MNNKKTIFITNIVTHYRETFYKKLNNHLELLLISSNYRKNDGRPALTKKIFNDHILVNNIEITLFGIDFIYQKGVLKNTIRYNPDVVIILGLSRYVSNWLILFYSKLRRKKIIIWTSGWERIKKRGMTYWVKRGMNFFYYNLADNILVYSTKGANHISSLLLNKNKIEVCYNGIEIDHLLKRKNNILKLAKEMMRKYYKKKIFLFVGGMLKEKKVDLLIKAFLNLKNKYGNITLWLVGDGPDIEYFKNLSKRNEDIIFWGRKVDDVDIFFAACDYFILPSLGGLALNQAMFWGKPCIVSEADGTEDDLVINGITGFRFQKNDTNSLIEVLSICINLDPRSYDNYSQKCINLITEQSNVNSMVNTFLKVINI